MLLLSVGMVVVSVLHELLQRCIIIDMQHLLQVSQSRCTAFGLLSCSTSMTSMMDLVDMELRSVSGLVWLPERHTANSESGPLSTEVSGVRGGPHCHWQW